MQTISKVITVPSWLSKPAARRGLMLWVLMAGFCIGPSSIADSGRRGGDPLSDAEASLAREAAVAAARAGTQAGAAASTHQPLSSATFDLDNPGEPLLLLVERRPVEKGESARGRLADVYAYDYSDDTLVHSIVDLSTGKVQKQEVLRETQLPLIASEVDRAAEIVMGDPETREDIERAYTRVTGEELSDISEIDFKAFVFHASTLPSDLVPESAMCGVHRCAQMITYTKDNISLDFSPIIDLSTGRVTQVIDR